MNCRFTNTCLTAAVVAFSGFAGSALAQTIDPPQIEEIVVQGIRGALTNALVEKRGADNIKEVIQAEDIGKLPDQNLAEVLENVTGIQITRAAGVGTGVQIRGTGANRVEVNGVSHRVRRQWSLGNQFRRFAGVVDRLCGSYQGANRKDDRRICWRAPSIFVRCAVSP